MIGRTLDHYRIESKLGEGGMGVVYKARDTHLNRLVAIKVLPPARMGDADRKERFVREARAASALNHPGIVTIHDIRSHEGVDFIVMEYLDGETLDVLIPAGGMPLARALKYAVQVADALARAHAAGILHRDIKPSNVMLTRDGRMKVLDFGLAKLIQPDQSPEAPTQTARPLTEQGVVVGTAAYMSPEQAEGRELDTRSDVFSFGALLYEMVTGRRPFVADSWLATLTKILNEDPRPPGQLVPAVPPDLEKAILRCLRKDPARRFQTMADLKVALEDLEAESASGQSGAPAAARATSPWRRWKWAALVPALAVAAFFAWRAGRAPTSAEPLRAVALTTFSGVERYPSLSPDGDEVAYSWNGPKQDNEDVYVQRIGSGSPLRLTTDPASESNPVWSPDDRWIAFLRGNAPGPMSRSRYQVTLVPPLGGPERRVADISVREVTWPVQAHLAWCPDASCLVVTDSPGEGKPDALFVVSVETGEKRQLTNPRPPAVSDTGPAISPDGRALVFRRTVSYAIGELWRLRLAKGMAAAGEPERRTMAAFNADWPAWLPGGREILLSARGGLWRLAVFGSDPPERLPFVGDDGLSPSISHPRPGKPSRLVYARSFIDDNIWRLDVPAPGAPATSPPAVAISSTRSEVHPKFSPDGRRIAFTSTRSGSWEIWVSDADGGNAVKLTSMDANATGGPNWSPDGSWIVFGSDQPGQFEIYAIPAAGGKPHRLTSHPAFDQAASFSRDGKWIYFASNRTGEFQIWKMPAAGGVAIQVTRDGGWVSNEAPDGAHLYYIDIPMAPKPLWRVSAAGGPPVKVVDGVFGWFFQATEQGIYYADQADGETRLRFHDFGTGRSTTVAGHLGQIGFAPGVSPDGRTILYSQIDSTVDDLMLVENFR
ncbi:MAG TPA: protein kinase [Thermoanaerobaculia bacterium]|nr:protein kinase [Thermoanaerobaculia bacterium]